MGIFGIAGFRLLKPPGQSRNFRLRAVVPHVSAQIPTKDIRLKWGYIVVVARLRAGSSRRVPKSNLGPRPLAASPRRPKYFAPDQLWAPSRVGRGPPLLDVCAKNRGFRTFWHNLALRLPVIAEVRTVCHGYHGFLCGLLRGPGGGPGGPGSPEKPRARDPARQVVTACDLDE